MSISHVLLHVISTVIFLKIENLLTSFLKCYFEHHCSTDSDEI